MYAELHAIEFGYGPMTKIPDVEAHRRDALEILRLLARAEKEIEAGEGRDLDAVMAEADALLAEWQQDD